MDQKRAKRKRYQLSGFANKRVEEMSWDHLHLPLLDARVCHFCDLALSSPHTLAGTPDPTTTPPVFWTEVFSRADARWLPVDPVRCIVNKRKMFDPTPSVSTSVRQENRMVYVVAFEE